MGSRRRWAWAPAVVLALLSAPGALRCAGQNTSAGAGANFEVATQGYYFGGKGSNASGITGLAVNFRSFVPGVGAISGNFEGYGRDGEPSVGDNYLQLRGFAWLGMRWGITGGDFRVAPSLVEFPFNNIFLPEIAARGVRIESSSMTRQYSVFYGTETLLEGPRVPFRITTPQRVLGGSVVQKLGERLQIGVRALYLSTSTIPESLGGLFPPGENFRTAVSVSAQGLFRIGENFRLYGEATLSSGSGTAEVVNSLLPAIAARGQQFSYTFGPVWNSPRLTIRANYIQQAASYLPLAGYYLGDRKGPFGEVRYRPWKMLEVFGSASAYRNNLSADPRLPVFQSSSTSGGVSLSLPFKISASGQISTVNFDVKQPGSDVFSPSQSRQISTTISRPIRTHNVHVAFRDLTTNASGREERQLSTEFEDIFQFHRMSLGAAVREQRLTAGGEHKTTLFFRGSGQALFGRFSAYAYIEHGNDLANQTVFATSIFNTTVIGAAARITKDWNLRVEASRNQLVTELNPENIFLFGSQGVGISNALSLFNQWTAYFRLSRQMHFGKPLPSGDLDQYVAQQLPVVGSIEGVVLERTMSAARPAKGIPVTLDDNRVVNTTEDGSFRFSGVPEGEHRVALAGSELPAEYNAGAHPKASVSIRARHSADVQLDVVPLLTLTGHVFGPPGVDLSTVVVRLLPGKRYTTPAPDGRFAFYNLIEGDYQLVLEQKSLPEYSVVTSDPVIPVALRVDQKLEEPRFYFEVHKVEKPIRRTFEKKD